MPKINRIRIANVSWEKRIILDELYDSYDGEDMLLNLANGGGKSVLVQMMLQPILPTRRIHKRKIDDYLSKTSAPSYIMIEWKLDNSEHSFYLLTGVAMCSIGQSDEQSSRTKYFTFLNYYDEANDYDIRRIPLIAHEEGGVIYTPYDKARELLRQANGESFQLRCFIRDESEAYKAALREYGILPEEWEFIADINDKEGGVDELFAACKTSDSLMDRWILKTVSEELSGGSKELAELFRTLMSSILEKEETLKEKELLEDFSQKADDFVAELSALCTGLDAAEKTAGELSGLYVHLNRRKQATEQKKAELSAQEWEQNGKLETIHQEEVSENCLHRAEEYHTREQLWQKAKTLWEDAKRQHTEAKQARECLEAARYAEERQRAREMRRSLNEQLKLLRSGRADEDFQRVVYTLFVRYSQAIQDHEGEIARLRCGAEEDAGNLRKTEQRGKELEELLVKARREDGVLEERVRNFRSYEEKTLRELSLVLARNLLGELPPSEIEFAQKELQKREAALQAKKENLTQATAENKAQAAAQKVERETLGQHRESAGLAIEQGKQALAAFTEARARRQGILARHGIPTERLYDGDYCQNELVRLGEERQKELDSVQRRYLSAMETLHDCETGNLHTAHRYGELLAASGIVYDTGETYLSRLSQEEQDAFLRANPMLPYCFLVAKGDLARLPVSDEAINRVCPVIAFEDVATPGKPDGRMVELPSGLRLACFYNGQSLRAETKEAYADLLRQEIERQAAAKRHLQEQRAQLEADLHELKEAFPYTAESSEQLAQALEDAKREYQRVKSRVAELEIETEQTAKEASALVTALQENKEKAETAERHRRLFADFLERDDQYRVSMRRQNELAAEISDANHRLTQNRTLERELTESLAEKKRENTRLQQELDDCHKRRAELGSPSTAELLEGSLPVLEERYRDILNQRNQDENSLHGKIKDAVSAENNAEKALRRYGHLSPALYENMRFTDEALSDADEKERQAEKAAAAAQDAQAVEQGKYTAAQERMADARRSLSGAGLSEPLPPEQIYGNYGQRRQDIKELLGRLSTERAHCEQVMEELTKRSNRILNYIAPEEVLPLAAPREGGWEEFDIVKAGKNYKETEERNKEQRSYLQERLRDLRRNYGDKHPILTRYLRNIPLEETASTYSAYYFVYERMTDQSARLRDTLAVLAADLAHLETDKQNIVRHALIQGHSLYDGLRQLSKSSLVNLWPGSPPRQTLKIGVPEVLDGEEDKRMAAYVEHCIAILRAEKAAGTLPEETLRKRVGALFSDRELLCQVLNTANIPVSLYKVDQIKENSGLRSWEDVLVENSGGELFVSCFVLVSALMSYRRNSIMGKSGVTDTTRVFLIDNPFGKTSSKHLLEAMLRVAKKFKTQMICLSDLSQSSITNRFALIYQLSVRQALYSRNSYLRTDEVRRNGDIRQNERLEHMVLRTPPEQMSLFGD
ncbi:hypothetical protein [Desulfitobacterium sp.]|uniref:hypothetical protein n=1 Tax=Desulfitobacterium sp. TaxID=49981 RepID=UPI002B1F6BB9|nr:hypothetical protein [Desulfitobacterium sp.]MEA4901569.1 hypothetical protein [Desulfitobacterium sp.]